MKSRVKQFAAVMILLIAVIIAGRMTIHGTREQVRYSSSGAQIGAWLEWIMEK